jgi:hypothetical protein
MSYWLVITIIILVLVFIVSMMTALLYSKPIQMPKEYLDAQKNKTETDKSDDNGRPSIP